MCNYTHTCTHSHSLSQAPYLTTTKFLTTLLRQIWVISGRGQLSQLRPNGWGKGRSQHPGLLHTVPSSCPMDVSQTQAGFWTHSPITTSPKASRTTHSIGHSQLLAPCGLSVAQRTGKEQSMMGSLTGGLTQISCSLGLSDPQWTSKYAEKQSGTASGGIKGSNSQNQQCISVSLILSAPIIPCPLKALHGTVPLTFHTQTSTPQDKVIHCPMHSLFKIPCSCSLRQQ